MICGARVEWQRGREPQTCGSDVCRRARRAQSVREYRWRSRGGSTTQTRACLECGSPFEYVRVQGMMGQGPGHCSEECRRKRHLARTRCNQTNHRTRLPVEERARRRRSTHLARYKLTPEQYEAMVVAQGGVCAICGSAESKHHSPLLKIDHNRSCCPKDRSCGKCVRGLLCSNCNRGLGMFGDNPAVLRAASDYLEQGATVTSDVTGLREVS